MSAGSCVVGFHGWGGLEYMRPQTNCMISEFPDVDSVARDLIGLLEDQDRARDLGRAARAALRRGRGQRRGVLSGPQVPGEDASFRRCFVGFERHEWRGNRSRHAGEGAGQDPSAANPRLQLDRLLHRRTCWWRLGTDRVDQHRNTTAFGDLSPGNGFTQTKSGFVGAGQIAATFRLTNGSSALKAPSPAPASRAMSPMARSAPPSTFSPPGSTSLRPSLAASATPSTIGCPTSRAVMPAPTLSSASTTRLRRIGQRDQLAQRLDHRRRS